MFGKQRWRLENGQKAMRGSRERWRRLEWTVVAMVMICVIGTVTRTC